MATQKFRNRVVKKFHINRQAFGHKFWQVIFTFFLVSFAWIFFRSGSLYDAFHIIRSIVTLRGISYAAGWNLAALGLSAVNLWIAFLALLIFCIFEAFNRKLDLLHELNRQPLAFRWLVYLTILFSVIIFGYFGVYSQASFVYAQF